MTWADERPLSFPRESEKGQGMARSTQGPELSLINTQRCVNTHTQIHRPAHFVQEPIHGGNLEGPLFPLEPPFVTVPSLVSTSSRQAEMESLLQLEEVPPPRETS